MGAEQAIEGAAVCAAEQLELAIDSGKVDPRARFTQEGSETNQGRREMRVQPRTPDYLYLRTLKFAVKVSF